MSQNGGGPQRPLPPGIRVNQIATLPHLNDVQKTNYTRGVASLYEQIKNAATESQEYKTACAKLMEFTNKMGREVQAFKQEQQRQQAAAAQAAAQAAAAAGGSSNDRPQSRGQQGSQPQPPQPSQPPQQHAVAPPQSQVPPAIMNHVQNFQFQLPPGLQAGSPEAQNKIKEMKATYAKALTSSESSASQIKKLESMVAERQAQGQDIPADFAAKKQQLTQQYTSAKNFLDEFRKRQHMWKQQREHAAQQGQQVGGPGGPGGQQPQAPPPQAAPAPQIKTEGGAPPNNPNAPPQQMGFPPNVNTGASNPAVEAARAQLNRNRTSQSPATGPTGQPQQPQPPYPQNLSQPQAPPQQMPQVANPNMNPNMNNNNAVPRPQLNPQQASHVNQPQQQNSPHAQGQPVPLTHGQAMTQAARSYSDQRATPQIPAAQGYTVNQRDNQLTNPKMPIPKTLNVAPPHPVQMGAPRPTLGGPSNGAPGMMGQPVIAAHPQYHLEGDDNRVLSKKKLDELVRQVTGGGEGPAGESLTPEVEEAMLQLADDFLDNVVTSACKLAKLRESSTLEIRDIQAILERNYNIRIPGYASDEVRTVRKFQPAPGWTQKMNAVQSAKVMNGKTDD